MLASWLPAPPVQSEVDMAIPVFNEKDLLERLMGDRELAGVVLEGFLEDAPSQLSKLGKSIDEADLPEIRLQAHTLKGVVGHGWGRTRASGCAFDGAGVERRRIGPPGGLTA